MGIGERGPMVAILVGGGGTRDQQRHWRRDDSQYPQRVRGDRDSGWF